MPIFTKRKIKNLCQIAFHSMETIKFKTNIKCGGCIATVTPFFNADENIEKWGVDLLSADRVLTVETNHSSEEVTKLVKKAGYTAEEIA